MSAVEGVAVVADDILAATLTAHRKVIGRLIHDTMVQKKLSMSVPQSGWKKKSRRI